MNRTTRADDQGTTETVTTTMQTITQVIAVAMATWPTTLRFIVICLVLSLPVVVLAAYFLVR